MMKNLINNVKFETTKQISIIIFLVILSISTIIIVSDLHEQSLLDREYGKLLIREKQTQLNAQEGGC